MRDRLILVLSLGAFVAACIFAATQYFLRENRYRTADELREEAFRKQLAEDIAAMRANAKTPEEKTLVEYIALAVDRKKFEAARDRIRISDGVDQFEAWVFACEYFGRNFGICGAVNLPVREGSKWRVPIGVGSTARPGTIVIDAQNGVITCDGHPTVTDPIAYLRK